MKHSSILVMGLSALTLLASCGGNNTPAASSTTPAASSTTPAASSTTPATSETAAEGIEYALVTDVGDIDDESFNQTAWEATRDYAVAQGKTYAYYRPTADSKDARLAAIDQAVAKGAKICVCPGYLFETAIYEAQTTYPDVKFVLLDGAPHTDDYSTYETKSNTVSIAYMEQIAGYLAGYAAVKDGCDYLGYCGGMAVASVQRYGTGYVQGIDAAAKELKKNVQVSYYYAGAFQATNDATLKMKGYYADGCDAVFACGGKVYQSVLEGCHSVSGKKWIGVDVDQNNVDPGYVLTSAMKDLYQSVTSALELYSADKFSSIGGHDWNLGLNSAFGEAEKKDYVAIPTANWNFTTFTKDEYSALLTKIGNGEITISGDVTSEPTVSEYTTVNWDSEF